MLYKGQKRLKGELIMPTRGIKLCFSWMLCAMFIVGLLSLSIGTANGGSALDGKWQISKNPAWVKQSFLGNNGDIFRFFSDGSCVWGRAGDTYKVIEKNTIKVNIPMQEATPGYVGVLDFTIKGDQLELVDAARKEPIILKRVK